MIMNLPEITPYEDLAIDIVVYILNNAKARFGIRQNLFQFALSRNVFASKFKISLGSLRIPLAITSEKLVEEVIEKHWKLTPTFKYIIKCIGSSQDESAQYYYLEAIFSQPTVEYPIPQATASVFFRVQGKQIEPPQNAGVPRMHYRVDGDYSEYDIRCDFLPADKLLGLIKAKMKLFKRIENMRLF